MQRIALLLMLLLFSAFTKQEHQCLAHAVYGESRGQPLSGQYKVAGVVLNRVDARQSYFGFTICDVVYKRRKNGGWEFDGAALPVRDNEDWRVASWVAYHALIGYGRPDPEVLYFCAPRSSTCSWHRKRLVPVDIDGGHVFYADPHLAFASYDEDDE